MATGYYPAGDDPIGIADFGQASGGTVSYTSSSFDATATIDSLSVCATSSPCGSRVLSFQLNVNLGFENGGSWYVYWIQDVAFLNTSNNYIYFLDNVWNFSGSSASIYPSTLSGNGQIGSSSGIGFYYDIASPFLQGNFAHLSYPSTFSLIVNTTVSGNGKPVVDFLYQNGGKWIAYDQVTFSFVSQLSYSDNFMVDGSTLNPAGLGYDAEMVLGGPGGGSGTIDESSNLQLTLEFWSGHNYETINNAENHGEDTGETITNANAAGYYYTSDGWLYSQVSAGTENIAPLWFSSNIALVEVQGPGTHNAMLEWGVSVCVPYQPCVGDEIIAYLSGNATIAIGPVTLEFQVIVGNEGLVLGPYSFGAGTFTVVSAGNWFTVTFLESGLPSGASWGVSVAGDARNTSGSFLSFFIPAFESPFTVFGGAGYLPIPSAGIFYVSGSSENISVVWEPVVVFSSAASESVDVGQTVAFSTTLLNNTTVENYDWMGLPSSCSTANSSVVRCSPTSAGLSSVTVHVTDSNGFVATSAALSFTVYADPTVSSPAGSPSSSDVGQPVTFLTSSSPGSGGDTYAWTGLPRGCTSSDSTTVACSPTAAGVFSVNVTVTDSNGYVATATGTFTVYSPPSIVSVTVSPGTSILDGQALTFSVNVTVGSGGLTYAWAGLPAGCQAISTASLTCTPSSTGTWNVSVTVTDSNGGSASSLGVTVVVQPSFLGLPALEGYALFIVAPIVAALAIVLAVVVRRKSRKRRTSSDSGGDAGGAQPYSPFSDPSLYGRSPGPAASSRFAGGAPIEAGVSPVRFEEGPTGIEGLDPGSVYGSTPMINPPDPVCWHCHFENPPGSRYCTQCALPLEPPPPTGSASPASEG